jgi:ABC-type lipoprotein export system ATPase subunit
VSAIEVKDLFRVYSTPEGDAAALQGLSLTVREREVVTVLGPSGSGKSTLLRVLAGLERPSAGVVRVFGHNVGKLEPRALASYRTSLLGYADQHYSRSLAHELTARELVAVQLGLAGFPRVQRLARADELLARVGLADRRDRRPAELSGGEQQRVAVCAALAHRPQLLLADEPTGELDHANADLVYDLIGELARESGATAVVVSHDPESARIADRIVRIRDGRVSEEWMRSGDETGDTIVVGRGGWLRLPEELLSRAGIVERATARFDERGIVVSAVSGLVSERHARWVSPGSDAARSARPRSGPVEGGSGENREVPPATDHLPAAEARGIRKAFGPNPVLSGFDATFTAGALHAITGPSGSGKTTLLHILGGLELPDAGDVTIGGRPLTGLDRAGRARVRREHVGFVGQQPGLVPFLSARENVELGLAIRGLPPAGALEILDVVGLAERAEQRVSRLSAGERERVAIARALAPRPTVLLLDEPTSKLDQANALAVAGMLARLARETGAAILCATHDPVVIDHADDRRDLTDLR